MFERKKNIDTQKVSLPEEKDKPTSILGIPKRGHVSVAIKSCVNPSLCKYLGQGLLRIVVLDLGVSNSLSALVALSWIDSEDTRPETKQASQGVRLQTMRGVRPQTKRGVRLQTKRGLKEVE
ncbi:hypothetical protein ElyMa_006765000 [Elysia marginata]|uniref:Uncharacterized protein n=1 Tax=Elysia marginata TaxID=1093978 RepID=A0AAV4IX95_9GAST|nr:hypothetical protein ElyMa_006765000 [Elysia marginata]